MVYIKMLLVKSILNMRGSKIKYEQEQMLLGDDAY